ncbi:MAG TPA: hypothetical protein VIL11_03815 [Limnochordales bacterium]
MGSGAMAPAGPAGAPAPFIPIGHGARPAPATSAAQAAAAGRAGSFVRELRQAVSLRRGPGGPGGDAGPEAVGELDPGRVPAGRQGLHWAAQQLEAQLWAWMLRQALEGEASGGLFGRNFAGSVYGDWMAQAVAELLVQQGPSYLSAVLEDQLSGAGAARPRPRRADGPPPLTAQDPVNSPERNGTPGAE